MVNLVISCTANGALTASEVLLRFPCPYSTMTFPAGMTGSRCIAGTAAANTATLSLSKDGASFGSIVFSASGTSATFSAASQTVFAQGSILTISAPSSPDATLADLGIALVATFTY